MRTLCLMLFSTVVSATEPPTPAAGQSLCKVKSVEEVMQEPLCGNDQACAARKKAALDQALEAHRCEMQRIAPLPLPQMIPGPTQQ